MLLYNECVWGSVDVCGGMGGVGGIVWGGSNGVCGCVYRGRG